MSGGITVAVARRLLADAPWARERFRPYAGQAIRWDIAGLQGSVVLDADGFPVAPDPAAVPDARPSATGVRVTLAAADLANLTQGMDVLMRYVVIEGNAGLASELAFVARNLQVDPADWLAPWMGDILAERTRNGLAGATRWSLQAMRRAATAGAEFAVHEARLLADRQAVSAHCRAVDEVREAADRMAQRIARLERSARR